MFVKFGFNAENEEHTFRVLAINDALPFDDDKDANYETNYKTRIDVVKRIANDLVSENALTVRAAIISSLQLSQL